MDLGLMVGYWQGGNWWGVGPGAHSHVGGVRWWNAKHPAAYAERLAAGVSPAQAREVLTADEQYDEELLLGVRLVDGVAADRLRAAGAAKVESLLADGLLDPVAWRSGRVALTDGGRLLADAVVRSLLA